MAHHEPNSITVVGAGEHAFTLMAEDTILVRSGITLEAEGTGGVGVLSEAAGTHNQLIVAGEVTALQGYGIHLFSDALIQIESSGSVFGGIRDGNRQTAILLNGGSSAISNSGRIEAEGWRAISATLESIHDVFTFFNAEGGLVKGHVVVTKGTGFIANKGMIDGAVAFITAETADLYDGREGQITQQISLGGGNDKAYGGLGAETIDGGKGDDMIDGGGGDDTAVFSGTFASYAISNNNDGTFTISDNRVDGDGADLLKSIRFAKFSDRTITLNNAPKSLVLSNASVAENVPAATVVGRLSATDADGDAVGFSLASNPDGAFAISGEHLVLARPLDFEAKAQYSVSVKATDAYGAETVQTFTITATDVAEHLVLRGTSGANVLTGQAGHDTLYGAAGKDVLTGGTGKDVFVFDTRPNSRTNLDTLTDFSTADDTIHLKKSVFAKIAKKGALQAKAFWTGTKAHDADDRIVYNKKTGILYYDADGSGAGQQVAIAKFSNKAPLAKDDFFVI